MDSELYEYLQYIRYIFILFTVILKGITQKSKESKWAGLNSGVACVERGLLAQQERGPSPLHQ